MTYFTVLRVPFVVLDWTVVLAFGLLGLDGLGGRYVNGSNRRLGYRRLGCFRWGLGGAGFGGCSSL